MPPAKDIQPRAIEESCLLGRRCRISPMGFPSSSKLLLDESSSGGFIRKSLEKPGHAEKGGVAHGMLSIWMVWPIKALKSILGTFPDKFQTQRIGRGVVHLGHRQRARRRPRSGKGFCESERFGALFLRAFGFIDSRKIQVCRFTLSLDRGLRPFFARGSITSWVSGILG